MSEWLDISKVFPWLEHQQFNILENNSLEKIDAELDSVGFEIYLLDGEKIFDQESFFEQASKSLGFPDYFGRNWNAFIDSLRDLELRTDRRIALIWTHAENLLKNDVKTFLEAVYWIRHNSHELGSLREDGSQPIQMLIFIMIDGSTE